MQDPVQSPDRRAAPADESLNLREMLDVLAARKWTAIVTGILCVAVALKIALTTPPAYLSSAKIVCKTSETGGGQFSQLAAMAGISLGQGQTSNPSLYFEDLIGDDEFLEGILARRWRYGGDSASIAEIWKMEPDTARENWEYAFRKQQVIALRRSGTLKLKKNPKNGVFEIVTQFQDPVIARELNEFVIDWLNQYLVKAYKTQARENRRFIEERIKAVAEDLEGDEIALAQFRERNIGVNAPMILMQQSRLARNLNVNQEVYLQLTKQLELAKIEELKDQPLIEVISKPVAAVDRFKPQRRKIMMLAAVLAVILGVGAAFFHNWLARMLVRPAR